MAGRIPRLKQYLLTAVVILVPCALVAAGVRWGWSLVRSQEGRPPVVLVGSRYVFPYVKRDPEVLTKVNALWIDIASNAALKAIFFAFDYGRSAESRDRVGLVALSSNGTKPLE